MVLIAHAPRKMMGKTSAILKWSRLILMTLLFLEVGFRIFWKIKWTPRAFVHDPRYQVNSLGYRGKEWSLKKVPGTYRIICVGDSTVYGSGSSPSSDFPTLLELILNQDQHKLGVRYEVFNGGGVWGNGDTSLSLLPILRRTFFPYEPDLVVVMVGINELEEDNPELPSFYRKDGIVKRVGRHSYLVRVWSGLVFKVLLPNVPVSAEQMKKKKERAAHFVSKTLHSGLIALVRTCKDRNVNIILVTLPHLSRVQGVERSTAVPVVIPYFARNPSLYKIIIGGYNDLVRLVSLQENIPVAEMAGYFEGLPNGFQYFLDNVHLTDEGNRIFAQHLAQEIHHKVIRASGRESSP